MQSRVHVLHRRGQGTTDAYGADLALTVDVPDAPFLKTAFFQLKRSQGYKATLERSQLDQAKVVQKVWDRSYAAVFDEQRAGVRIEAVAAVLKDFPRGQKTHSVVCGGWMSMTRWL